MIDFKKTVRPFSMVCAIALGMVVQASAQEANLPGGASSLTETHANWTVACRSLEVKDAADGAKKAREPDQVAPAHLCALTQRQVTEKGEHVLSVELQAEGDGLKGVFVLPFGLALAKGMTLQIDEGERIEALAFSTCVPSGCIVPLTGDSAMVDALRLGQALNVLVSDRTGQALKFVISLTGFTSAFDRVREFTLN